MVMVRNRCSEHVHGDHSLAGMGASENKRLLGEAEERLSRGDGQGWFDLLAEDVRWTVTGGTAWSRTYEGRAAVRTELIDPLRDQYAEPYRRTPVQLVAEDDVVVARCRGHVTTKAGERYDNDYCFVYRFRDGLIREIIEYGDTALIDRVLAPPS